MPLDDMLSKTQLNHIRNQQLAMETCRVRVYLWFRLTSGLGVWAWVCWCGMQEYGFGTPWIESSIMYHQDKHQRQMAYEHMASAPQQHYVRGLQACPACEKLGANQSTYPATRRDQ